MVEIEKTVMYNRFKYKKPNEAIKKQKEIESRLGYKPNMFKSSKGKDVFYWVVEPIIKEKKTSFNFKVWNKL